MRPQTWTISSSASLLRLHHRPKPPTIILHHQIIRVKTSMIGTVGEALVSVDEAVATTGAVQEVDMLAT